MAQPFLDADRLRAGTFVRHVEIHDTLGSTNDRAAELARDANIELPALIAARQQTAGRGRGQHTWWSSQGALTFSLLFNPIEHGIDPATWPQLSLAAGVAICDALQGEAPDAAIALKWPNDVILNGGKVAGILIESPGGTAPAKDRLIIGIGINVNNFVDRSVARSSWATRDELKNAIVLCEVTGCRHDLGRLLIDALQAMEVRNSQLASRDPVLAEAWQRLDWLKEQAVEVYTGDRWINGVAVGIDHEGALLVERVFGTHRILSGSVRVR